MPGAASGPTPGWRAGAGTLAAGVGDEPAIENSPSGPRRIGWGLGEAIAGYAVAFFASGMAGAIWYAVTGREEASLGLVGVTLVAQWTGLAGAALVVSRWKGAGSLREDFGLRVEARDVLPGVAFGVGVQLVLLPLLYVPFRLLNPDLDLAEEARELTDLARGPGLVLLAVGLVIGAPLVEELFFRGLLLRALDQRFGPRWAVGVSAVAFGVTHFQPLQLLGLVAFGVVLGLLAQRKGRLGPSLVAHAAFNTTTVVLLVAAR